VSEELPAAPLGFTAGCAFTNFISTFLTSKIFLALYAALTSAGSGSGGIGGGGGGGCGC
jgi:hypothetical protein